MKRGDKGKMIMDSREIYTNWKCSANKKQQVRILDELNGVSMKEISNIILEMQKKEETRDMEYKLILEKCNKVSEESEESNKAAVLDNDSYKAITTRLDELEHLITGYQAEYRRLSNLLMNHKV